MSLAIGPSATIRTFMPKKKDPLNETNCKSNCSFYFFGLLSHFQVAV